MASSITLTVDNLSVERGGRLVLDRISVSVAAGDALIITGPNGAGKTTFLRALAGLVAPSSGHVTLDGGDPERDLGQQCHYAGHLDAVKPRLTVAENLSFWAKFLGGYAEVEARVQGALASLGLADLAAVSAGYLSAGQRRRLGLARLIVARRPIWLLDEPSVSLDRDSVAALIEMIKDHLATGGIALAATHADLGLAGAKSMHLASATAAEP